MPESTDPVVAPEGLVPRGYGPASLRSPLTSLIGRKAEIPEVSALLLEGRLVTLTGAGGTGKTRLAQAVMHELVADGDGIAFVDLAAVNDAALVPAAILSSLGSRASADQSPIDLVADLVGGSDYYLVLDNFEHVTSAAPLVMELLQRCPQLVVLVTSRRRLKLSAERIYEVPPLAVPPPGERPSALDHYDSVRLFRDRAAEAGGAIDSGDLPVVAEICRRLEGLPLAIELAAAHARYLSVQALLGRLDEPLPLLAGGPVDAPARQRALQHSIAWSYDLLSEQQRAFIGRLGAFEGPFRLAAAHQVAAEGLYESQAETLEALAELSDHGLVLAEASDDAEARFRMHDAIRDFAQRVADDSAAARDRVLNYYVRLAEQAEPELEHGEAALWTRVLGSEIENLRGALAWAYKSSSTVALLRLATALGDFWRFHGDLREGREWLSRAVLTAQLDNPSLMAKAQLKAARIYRSLGERDQALLLYESARKNAEAAEDLANVADSLVMAGGVMIEDGRLAEAEPLIDEGLALARTVGDHVLAAALLEKGVSAHFGGSLEEARRLYAEAAEIAQTLGNLRLAAVALVNSADTEFAERDYEAAARFAGKGAAYLDTCDDLAYAPWAHLLLGMAHRRLGDMEAARSEVCVGATKALAGGSPADVIFAAEAIADWLGADGMSGEALVSWAAATNAREDLDYPRQPTDDAWINEGIERDRSALASEVASKAWNDGAELGIRDAVSAGLLALAKTPPGLQGSRHHGVRTHDKKALTPRELEVLRLLAEGRSDRDIAKALSISPGTAAAHVASIKWKLAASSRVQIATTAIRKGLIDIPAE
jgi:predicted ATPase/DNA-binding CsgD family transcriptional regulator